MPPKRIGLKTALGIGIAVLSSYLLFALRAHLTLNHELAEARKEGLWTTLDDIANRPAPPADRNAALVYQPLCKVFHDAIPRSYILTSNALRPGGEPAFEALYHQAEPYLKEFARAAAMPECQFQRKWRPGLELFEFSEMSEMQWAFRLVCLHATLMARHAKAIEALDLIRRFAPMARHLGSEPEAGIEWQETELDGYAFTAVQTILGAHGLEPRVLENAKAAVAALGPTPESLTPLSGDCAMFVSMLDDRSFRDAWQLSGRWLGVLGYIPAARDVWKADLLRNYREMHAAIKATGPHASAMLERLAKIAARRSEVVEMFAYSNWYRSIARDSADRVALAALISGLESWRKSGACPTVLPITMPPLVDPMTDALPHFAKIPGGFKVWCIATDGTDHGGSAYVRGRGGSPDHYDTVYAYPYGPPAKKAVAPNPPVKPNAQPQTT